jgi:hypothetical protein
MKHDGRVHCRTAEVAAHGVKCCFKAAQRLMRLRSALVLPHCSWPCTMCTDSEQYCCAQHHKKTIAREQLTLRRERDVTVLSGSDHSGSGTRQLSVRQLNVRGYEAPRVQNKTGKRGDRSLLDRPHRSAPGSAPAFCPIPANTQSAHLLSRCRIRCSEVARQRS